MLFVTFLLFTAGVFAVTMYITRKDEHDSSDGYFLGGRSLTAGFIAGSLMLTNLSTEQLVGLNGSAFINGLSVMAWEVVAGMSLVIMALYFLPKFLRSGIATVPQFLEERFNATTRKITSIIFIFAYAVILLPLILFTGAKGMISILGLDKMLGMEFTQCLWIVVILIGVLGSIYAIFGGLKAVAVSDTLNGFGLLVGGIAISYFALSMVGGDKGLFEGYNIVKQGIPEKFNSISNPDGDVPFYTLFTGVLLLNLFYWTTNQQIIQRTFGATNLAEGQKGVLLAGGLKVLGPLILVLPGLLAFYFYKNGLMEMPLKENGLPDADQAYGVLVQTVMPEWMKGFFSAVLLGAILSSFNSALNSTCTLFSLGVYKGIIKQNATEEQVIAIGKKFGWIIAISSMIIAPLLEGQSSIFGYLQKMNAIYFVPIFAVVLVGMLTKRVPAIAANTGMLFAFIVIIAVYFTGLGGIIDAKSDMFILHNFHFIAMVLLISIAIMLVIGKLNPMPKPFVHKHSGDVDMTPWKGAKPAGITLIVVVLGIYINFADTSVIGEVATSEKIYAGLFMLGLFVTVYKFIKDAKKETVTDESTLELNQESSSS